MKIPEVPPDITEVFSETFKKDPKKSIKMISIFKAVDPKGRYLHWEKLKHIPPPTGFTSRQWWVGTKTARQKLYKELKFSDPNNSHFKYATTDQMFEDLLWLEKYTAGNINADHAITDPESRNTYLVSSLFEEAIHSSQMEGAATTYNDAKEMLREGRDPLDKGEQMILNNYRAMRFIQDFQDEQLTPELIKGLHKTLTENTLTAPNDEGRLRTSKDDIRVVDSRDNTVLHVPPSAKELSARMNQICQFANSEKPFIPALIRGIVLHFMLAYIHPFVDGNGRTARALFYWMAAKNKYWMIEYISISKVLKNEFGQYKNSYLFVETDDNDLTYFIIHQLSVIKKAIDQLNDYLKKKSIQIAETKKLLEAKKQLKGKLNYRQMNLLKHALDHPGYSYTIAGYKNSHDIYYDTARRDLLAMSEKYKLLIKKKAGKAFIFESPIDLKKRIHEKYK